MVLIIFGCRREILAEVGRDRRVAVVDRPNLPYTCALAAEVQRLANIFPMHMRVASEDVTIGRSVALFWPSVSMRTSKGNM